MLTDKEEIELLKLLEEEEIEEASSNYYEYVKYTHEDYMYNKHGEFISNKINELLQNRERMLRGEIDISTQYVMLSLPP